MGFVKIAEVEDHFGSKIHDSKIKKSILVNRKC